MGKYRSFGIAMNRQFRTDLNANFEDVDKDIQSQKGRVDELIQKNPQPSEVVDARGGFPVLRDRLDSVNAQLAQLATNQDIFKKRPEDIDDTERLQRVINYCATNKITLKLNGGQFTVKSLTIPPGLKMYGEGAVFKKPKLNAPPYNMTVEQMKWVRMLNVSYSGEVDSEQTVIDGITFDGNCWEMWDTPSYAQEQASLLFCNGDSTKKGKLKVSFNNCHFRNSVSDGIHLVTNVDASITACTSFDCFRGGLTITGGNTIVNVNGFRFNSDQLSDGIDIEVDSVGYASNGLTINLSNIVLDSDLDIGIPANSTCNIENLTMMKPSFYILTCGSNSSFNINNSKILAKRTNHPSSYFLNRGGKISVNNSDFILDDTENQSINVVNLYYYANNDIQSYKFENCTFSVINAQAGKKYVGVGKSNADANQGHIKFLNCYFKDSLAFGIYITGKLIEIVKSRFATTDFMYQGGSNQYVTVRLVIDGIQIDNPTCREMQLLDAGTIVEHYNTTLYTLENARINGSFSYDYRDGAYYTTYIGNRTIYAGTDPTTVSYVCGIVDDIFIADKSLVIDGVKHKKFKCTKMNSGGKSLWTAV